MKSLIALLAICCVAICVGASLAHDITVPAPTEQECGCCDACKCKECRCKEKGVRCCYDCPCAPCIATYCCEKCNNCRRYYFPVGRKCEVRLKCPDCGGVRIRSDQKKAAAVWNRLHQAVVQQLSRPLSCST